MDTPIESPKWVEEMLALAAASPRPVIVEPVRAGSIWVSRTSGRRGWVVWVESGVVCFSFNEGDYLARTEHKVADFLRLYREVK